MLKLCCFGLASECSTLLMPASCTVSMCYNVNCVRTTVGTIGEQCYGNKYGRARDYLCVA